jgi:hypothetical protein
MVSEPAFFHPHTGVLQRTAVLGGMKREGPYACGSKGEYQPVESHGDCRPQAALAIVDAKDQNSLGLERRTASLQQGHLLICAQILQDIQNKNQTCRRKLESTNVHNAQVCIQLAEGVASYGDPMPIQIATNQATAGVTESCETQGHAVTAAKIHDCS